MPEVQEAAGKVTVVQQMRMLHEPLYMWEKMMAGRVRGL
jgi:hypothetical protein